MKAELLSVGTELLLGEIVDTNSAYLARDLATRGVDVYWSVRVGDNRARLIEAILAALRRSDLLILIGGLGPTDDDVTREAIAEALGETPQLDPQLEATLRAYFERVRRPMPERNLKQAWLIASAEALSNPLGTAPGWLVRTRWRGHSKHLVALPGPPRELERMWLEEALPRLKLPSATLFVRTVKTYGMGESGIAEQLTGLTSSANPSVATYARSDGVHVRVAAKGVSPEQARQLAEPALDAIQARLGELIWGADDDTLAQLVLAALAARGSSLATMESITGGMVAACVTDIPGASAVFSGGVIAYTKKAKAAFGVPEGLLEARGSVSPQVAQAMAEAAASRLGADFGLATTGVAGPESLEGRPAGTAFVAIHNRQLGTVHTLELTLPPLQRGWIRERVTNAALATLLKQLGA